MIRMDIEISIFILNTLLYYISSLRCFRVAHAHDYVYSHPQRSELSTYSMVLYSPDSWCSLVACPPL